MIHENHENHCPEMVQKAARVAAMIKEMKRRGMPAKEMRQDGRKEAAEEAPIRLNKALGKKI